MRHKRWEQSSGGGGGGGARGAREDGIGRERGEREGRGGVIADLARRGLH